MIKATILFFITIAKQYKIRTIILVTYSIFSGYINSFWPILIKDVYNSQIVLTELLIIFIVHFSYEPIKELILFPMHNQASYKLRLSSINKIHEIDLDNVSSGKTISRLQRSSSGKYIFQNLISLFKYIAMISNNLYLIFHYNHKLGLVIFCVLLCYLPVIFFFKRYYIKLRKKAWEATEEAGHLLEEEINQTISARQGFSKNKTHKALSDELLAWHGYYLKSNVYLATLSLLCVLIVYISFLLKAEITVIFLTWTLANSLKSVNSNIKKIISTSADIEVFLEQNKTTDIKNRFYTKNEIAIENVKIHNKLGPFNFHSKARFIGIKGDNGIGKTQLALAIAGLIPFEGIIKCPKALYISLQNKADKNLSQGQTAMQILEQALKSQFDMLIIDELLEVLSENNLAKYINKLKNTEKKIMLISNKQSILEHAEEIIVLTNSK